MFCQFQLVLPGRLLVRVESLSPPSLKTQKPILIFYPNDCLGSLKAFDEAKVILSLPLVEFLWLAGRLNAATALHTALLAPMHEDFAPIGFSFEPPTDNSLEDRGKQNVPSPHLIVPVAMDRLGQRARTPFSVLPCGSSDNGGSWVP